MPDLVAKIAAVFGIPPVLLGERRGPSLPDPRCSCQHWGCQTGWWHCSGALGPCFVPYREDTDATD